MRNVHGGPGKQGQGQLELGECVQGPASGVPLPGLFKDRHALKTTFHFG